LPDPGRTAAIWRERAISAGIGDLYLARVEGFVPNVDPKTIGFDAAIENSLRIGTSCRRRVSAAIAGTFPPRSWMG